MQEKMTEEKSAEEKNATEEKTSEEKNATEEKTTEGKSATEEKTAEEKKESRKQKCISLAKDFGIAVAIAVVVSWFIRPTLVHETSMQPTIDDKDYLIMSKQAYRFGEIERGDVIIFKSDIKLDENNKKLLIKRVIGLPGDVITITDGKLYINGSEMKEDYIADGGTPGEIYNLIVPDDKVFVLGDHRTNSRDSRELGCIDQDKIIGQAVLKIFPFNDIKVI